MRFFLCFTRTQALWYQIESGSEENCETIIKDYKIDLDENGNNW